MLVDKIKDLCAKDGITIAELERIVGLSPNTVRRWDLSKPSYDKLELVARYFNMTLDSLVNENYDDDDLVLARKIRNTPGLSEDNKKELNEYLEQTIDIYLKAKGLIK